MLGSIPSPSSGSINIGPLSIHAYGLMIALGVIAAVWLTGRRLEQAGTGKREDIQAIAIWAVIAGVLGSRLYYVVTDKSQPWRDPIKALQIWNGGLGIPGALLFGIPTGMWLAKRRGLSMLAVADAAAPALPLAQAIGRLGNWWNQELFGRPTTLPWGLRIDDEHLTQNGILYAHGTLFHPTFLYEALWNLALCLVLIWIGDHLKLRPGRLMVVYVLGYFTGRFWIEGLRIDNANAGGGLRLNQWVALAVIALSAGFLVVDWLRHRGDPSRSGSGATSTFPRMSDDDLVLMERKDPGIAILTLNRPDRMNAWTGALSARYFERLDECEADDSVKVIVITGAGRGYCAGADMDNLAAAGQAQGAGTGGESPVASTDHRDVWETTKVSKPTIVAINGACAGIGLVQALMCDIRFAAEGVKFTTAFARRGLVAEYGISWVLPRLVGTANALDLLMSGRVFLADEAKAMGMVNDVVPTDQLMDHVLHYAADVAANACPTSMAVMKRQVYADATRSLEEASDGAIPLMRASLKRPDFVEGVQSYLQKRPPNFGPVLKDA